MNESRPTFRGFELVELVRAITEESPDCPEAKPYTYEVKVYPKVSHGHPITKWLPVHAINAMSKYLRMETGTRWAIQRGSNRYETITEEEFNEFKAKWESC